MIQKDKEILFKDLCARLPYNVKCEVIDRGIKIIGTLNGYTPLTDGSKLFGLSNKEYNAPDKYWQPNAQFSIEEIKPYLRTMSSMTSEEEKHFLSLKSGLDYDTNIKKVIYNTNQIDWLNKHHFDYRGLIDKGLAIEIKNN